MISMKENKNQCDPSSFSCDPHLPINPTQAQGATHGDYHMPQPEETHDVLSNGGSSSHSLLHQTNDNKWMSSKMWWMRRKMISKQRGRTHPSIQDGVQLDQSNNNNNNSASGIIRVCSNCNTTKTPLWRSGPQGPKSLCNACGIRQMKAKRAMRADVDKTFPFKKRFKNRITSSTSSSLSVNNNINNNNNNNNNNNKTKKKKEVRLLEEVTIRKLAFPQEERDAAILLMALSCGLIHG